MKAEIEANMRRNDTNLMISIPNNKKNGIHLINALAHSLLAKSKIKRALCLYPVASGNLGDFLFHYNSYSTLVFYKMCLKCNCDFLKEAQFSQ